MQILNIGIIGCGVIAPTHIWAIEENRGIQIKALCDISQAKMEQIPQSQNCLLFQDWKEMLKSPEVDIVTICLPHHLHEQAIIEALEAGKHVISEKPLAITPDQIQNIKKSAVKAQKKGIYSFGIFQHRYSPLIQEIQKVLKESALGEIIEADVFFSCSRTQSYYDSDLWRGLWETEGGGTLINQGIHTLDILYQLIGLPQEVEFSLFRKKLEGIEVEDKGVGFLHYDQSIIQSGKVPVYFENDLKTDWLPLITLKGTEGNLIIEDSEHFTCSNIQLSSRLDQFINKTEQSAPGKSCYGSLHSMNYADIITSITERQNGNYHKPEVSIIDLAQTTETVLALYQSHFQKKKIQLPLNLWIKPEKLAFDC